MRYRLRRYLKLSLFQFITLVSVVSGVVSFIPVQIAFADQAQCEATGGAWLPDPLRGGFLCTNCPAGTKTVTEFCAPIDQATCTNSGGQWQADPIDPTIFFCACTAPLILVNNGTACATTATPPPAPTPTGPPSACGSENACATAIAACSTLGGTWDPANGVCKVANAACAGSPDSCTTIANDCTNQGGNWDGTTGTCTLSAGALGAPVTQAFAVKNDCQGPAIQAGKPKGDENHCGILDLLVIIINGMSAIVAVAVVASIVAGGIQYSSAGGDNPEQIAKAKARIKNAIMAFAIFIFSFAFLQWLIPGGIF